MQLLARALFGNDDAGLALKVTDGIVRACVRDYQDGQEVFQRLEDVERAAAALNLLNPTADRAALVGGEANLPAALVGQPSASLHYSTQTRELRDNPITLSQLQSTHCT